MTVISDHADAMAVLKHPHMKQALYEGGQAVMADVLLTLHGAEHSRRRVAEFGVFGRGFFRHYEREVFPATLAPVLAPYLAAGEADLVELGYRVVMNLTADFAGIDRTDGDVQETETLLALIKAFSAAATVAHSRLDPQAINDAAAAGMEQLRQDFLAPSLARRRTLLAQGEPLPNDILSTLLQKADKVPLSEAVLCREIAFFLQAGAHSSANSFVNAVHEVLMWVDTDNKRRAQLLADVVLLQRCVHEALRLHPASPVAQRRAAENTELLGRALTQGSLVVVDLAAANRDVTVFGEDAALFNPHRPLGKGVWPWGLSFGYGTHACLGRDLDGGVPPKAGVSEEHLQMGIVPMLVRTVLNHGAQLMPERPAQKDTDTSRDIFKTYPVAFTGEAHR